MNVGTFLGSFFIFLMALTWCLIGELTQNLQTPGTAEYYPKTMFITYLSGCAPILLLIPWLIWRLVGTAREKWLPAERSLNVKKEWFYAKWAPVMMLVVFSCNYTWFLSLKHTLVSLNSIIYNCISVVPLIDLFSSLFLCSLFVFFFLSIFYFFIFSHPGRGVHRVNPASQ